MNRHLEILQGTLAQKQQNIFTTQTLSGSIATDKKTLYDGQVKGADMTTCAFTDTQSSSHCVQDDTGKRVQEILLKYTSTDIPMSSVIEVAMSNTDGKQLTTHVNDGDLTFLSDA